MRPFDDSPIVRNGNSLILAYDHGMEHGPVDFEPQPESADPANVFEVAKHDAVTAIAVQKGVAEAYYPDYEDEVNLLVKLNGNSAMWQPEHYYSPKHCTVEYAVEELGASAVGFTVYAGSPREDEMWKEFREVQEAARSYGVPVVLWAYSRGHGVEQNPDYDSDKDPRVISYSTRLALEVGADMAKVKYPGSREKMEEAIEMSGKAKVVMSGGSKASDEAFLSDVYGTISAGGNGLAVGRNVFQREDPEALLDKLEGVIFEGKTPDEVL